MQGRWQRGLHRLSGIRCNGKDLLLRWWIRCCFVALTPRLLPPFDLLLHGDRGQATSICCVDSTRLVVCHKARTSGDRVL